MPQIEDIYAWLEQVNLTSRSIWLYGIAILIVMVIAVREASSWFFKTDSIRRELRQVRKELQAIQARLDKLGAPKLDSTSAPSSGATPATESANATVPAKTPDATAVDANADAKNKKRSGPSFTFNR